MKIDRFITGLTIEGDPNWKLVRERDGLTKHSEKIAWIEWNEDGTGKEVYDDPDIGRSLIMSPFNDFFTWMTTEVIDILDVNENNIKFKTKNSTYNLYKI